MSNGARFKQPDSRWAPALELNASVGRMCLLSGLLLLCTGCGSSSPKPPPMLSLSVDAQSSANGGKLFYFLVRNVNEKQFVLDTYQEVAKKAFADPPDPSVLGVYTVVPGNHQDLSLPKPNQGQTALYFLFTQPGTHWKTLLSEPLADAYSLHIPTGNQLYMQAGKPWWDSLWPF